MVNSVSSESEGYFTDEGTIYDACFSAKTVKEYVSVSEKVIDKLHSILKTLDILVSHYNSELTDVHDVVFDLSDNKVNCNNGERPM